MDKILIKKSWLIYSLGSLAVMVWYSGFGLDGIAVLGAIMLVTVRVLALFTNQTEPINWDALAILAWGVVILILIPMAVNALFHHNGLFVLAIAYLLAFAWYYHQDSTQAWVENIKMDMQAKWEEGKKIPFFGVFLSNFSKLFILGIVGVSAIYGWKNQPWGIALPILVTYTLWRANAEINPGLNFGSGEEGKAYRHYWTGFFYLAILRNPVLAIPGIVWVIITILSPFTIPYLTHRLSFGFTTPSVLSFWLTVGALSACYWIRWAIGPWRRSGFVLSESQLVQCIPSKPNVSNNWFLSILADLILPPVTYTASIGITRIAHIEGITGQLGGKKYDPGLQYQQEKNISIDKVAGNCVDPLLVRDVNDKIDKLN